MAPVAAFSYSRFWALLDVDDGVSASGSGHDVASVALTVEKGQGSISSESATIAHGLQRTYKNVEFGDSSSRAVGLDAMSRDAAVEVLHILSMATDGSIGVRILRVGVGVGVGE